jgi:DNA-binding GntR family transcriptional regulator
MSEEPEISRNLRALAEDVLRQEEADTRIEAETRFHRALLEAGGVAPLVAFVDFLRIFFRRLRDSFIRLQSRWQQGHEQHLQIIEALEKGDLTTAQNILEKHIRCQDISPEEGK